MQSLSLHFTLNRSLRLFKTVLWSTQSLTETTCFRAGTPGVSSGFKWTKGVKAFSQFSCSLAIAQLQQLNPHDFSFQGGKGSAAHTLYEAMRREPYWLSEFFGADSQDYRSFNQIFCSHCYSENPEHTYTIEYRSEAPELTVKLYCDDTLLARVTDLEDLFGTLSADSPLQAVEHTALFLPQPTSHSESLQIRMTKVRDQLSSEITSLTDHPVYFSDRDTQLRHGVVIRIDAFDQRPYCPIQVKAVCTASQKLLFITTTSGKSSNEIREIAAQLAARLG